MKQPFTKHSFLIWILIFVSLAVADAQETEWEKCGFARIDSVQRATLGQSAASFETWMQKCIAAQPEVARRSTITIPVIVHVIHNGEAPGSGTNLPYAQVLSQIEVLNEDYQRRAGTNGYNTNANGAGLDIEFCAAILDVNGKELEEPGVHRYNGNRSSWSESLIESSLKPATYWEPTQYLNIWVLRLSNAGRNNILGYSQFPQASGLAGIPDDDGTAQTDGVVIDYRVFGSADKGDFQSLSAPYNKGRVTTHEVGHWLGLRHIWGDETRCQGTDYCEDTPPASNPHYDCERTYRTCGEVDMTENYMDYTTDLCQNTFTKNQKTRMLAVLDNSPRRKELKNSNACNKPPVVVNDLAISLVPNPTPDVVKITLQTAEATIEPWSLALFTLDGKNILKMESSEQALNLNLSTYASGVYFIKIIKGDYNKTVKIIKI